MIYGRKKLDAPLPSPRGSYDGVYPLIKPQERSQSMGVVAMDTIRGLGPLEECDTDLESQVNNCSDGDGGGGGDGVMSPDWRTQEGEGQRLNNNGRGRVLDHPLNLEHRHHSTIPRTNMSILCMYVCERRDSLIFSTIYYLF